MTNLYLSNEVYNELDSSGEVTMEGGFKHPFLDNLIIVNPKAKWTFNEKSVTCIFKRNDSLLEGYVDFFNGKKIHRKTINLMTFDKLYTVDKNNLNLLTNSYEKLSNDQRILMMAQHIFIIGVYLIIEINEGRYNKKTIKRPKFWKKNKKKYQDDVKYNSHYLVEIGRTYQQKNPDALTGKTELRYHMRRGHYRFIKSKGERVWIDAYYAGNKKLGEITKDYKK